MIKRSPRRNPRSKGTKLKHGLQICLLLGVCFWLIYQVKHSHDKKKELDEKDTTLSLNAQHHNDLPKLGRKDLHPDLHDKTRSEKPEEEDIVVDEEVNKEEKGHEKEKEEDTKHEEEEGEFKDEEVEREEHIHEDEEREGEGTDHLDKEREEEIRHEEEEQNEEAESEETKDKGRQGGDDEVDERDQEKIEGEADRDEEFMDEEKEREDEGEETESQVSESEDNGGEEKENQGNEDEDREVQTDNETQSEDQNPDHDGEDSSHEAREEPYKADDASSAVTHDGQIISTEPEKEGLEKSNENLAANDLQQVKYSIIGNPLDVNEDKNNSISQLELDENGHPLNVTAVEKQNDEITLTKSEDESPNNTTVTVLSHDQLVPSNKSMEVSSEAGDNQAGANLEVSGSSQQNGTLNVSESDQIQNATIDGRVTGDVSNLQTTQSEQVNNGMVYNSIDSSNSSSNLESGLSNDTIKPELTAAEDVNSGLASRTNESTEATRDERSDTRNKPGRTDENTNSSNMNATEDAIMHDPIDSSIGQDEREALIDLATLPETGTGGVNSGNAAEE
ncbi:high mobility group nucleosome-binding domain-containing protein [Salix suchowensis]|nr:high mobility group nucleosome-binding domain-containing protein [Salix suchowensis]